MTTRPTEADEAVEHIRQLQKRYNKRAVTNAVLFRASGVLVICLSATVPVLAGLDFGGKNGIIAVVGALAAVSAGLQGFYRWDRLWGLARRIDFDLAHLLTQWELDVAA